MMMKKNWTTAFLSHSMVDGNKGVEKYHAGAISSGHVITAATVTPSIAASKKEKRTELVVPRMDESNRML